MRRQIAAGSFFGVLTAAYMTPLTYYGLPWLSVMFTTSVSAVLIFLTSAVVYYIATAALKSYLVEMERSVITAGAVSTFLLFALFAGGIMLIEEQVDFIISGAPLGSEPSEGMTGLLMLSTLVGMFAGYLGAASEQVSLKEIFDMASEV